RLVPDLIQTVGRAHPGSDAGVHEIEKEQANNAIGRFARQRLHRSASDVMANHARALDPERIKQSQHVARVVVWPKWSTRHAAITKAPQVRRNEAVASRQSLHDGLPGEPEFRPAMKQQKGSALSDLDHVKRGPIRHHHSMLHTWPPACAVCTGTPNRRRNATANSTQCYGGP